MLDRQALQIIVQEVDQEIQQATDRALRADPPAKGSALRYLYSDRDRSDFARSSKPSRKFSGDPRTMVDEINLHAA